MSKNASTMKANDNLDELLSQSLKRLFAEVEGHQQEKDEIARILVAFKRDIKSMNLFKIFLDENKVNYHPKLIEAHKQWYQESQTSFQNNARQLMSGILKLAKYADPSLMEKLCQSIDNILKVLYNALFTGVVMTESCYVGNTPPKSQLYFFSSPPPATAAKEHLEALQSKVKVESAPISPSVSSH